jgi:hypothetical protein
MHNLVERKVAKQPKENGRRPKRESNSFFARNIRIHKPGTLHDPYHTIALLHA